MWNNSGRALQQKASLSQKKSDGRNEVKKSSEVNDVTDKAPNRTKSLLRGASLWSNLTLIIFWGNLFQSTCSRELNPWHVQQLAPHLILGYYLLLAPSFTLCRKLDIAAGPRGVWPNRTKGSPLHQVALPLLHKFQSGLVNGQIEGRKTIPQNGRYN